MSRRDGTVIVRCHGGTGRVFSTGEILYFIGGTERRDHFDGGFTVPSRRNTVITLENNRQTKKRSTLQVAASAAVCGTSSIARFSLLVRLVPCYPVCRLRPAFVNYAPSLGVRHYETSKAGSSSTHAKHICIIYTRGASPRSADPRLRLRACP